MSRGQRQRPVRERIGKRDFRVEDDLWFDARDVADFKHESLSAILRSALRAYLRRNADVLADVRAARDDATERAAATASRREADQGAGQDASDEHGETG